MSIRTLIVIPARYGSTRFPGKPLAMIAGQTMLQRVVAQARAATAALKDADFVVATDDERIVAHCAEIGAPSVMTEADAPSGSDRALSAADKIAPACAYIINLQGDAPFTPVNYLTAMAKALEGGECDVATPCIHLDWAALDALREAKLQSPSSGTTCIMATDGRAVWFSKTIIPGLRNEKALRAASPLSPIYRHVGLYGFTRKGLKQFTATPPSHYEKIEGLEQLRMLETGMTIKCVIVEPHQISTSGIDTPEDRDRLEALIAHHGEPGIVL